MLCKEDITININYKSTNHGSRYIGPLSLICTLKVEKELIVTLLATCYFYTFGYKKDKNKITQQSVSLYLIWFETF